MQQITGLLALANQNILVDFLGSKLSINIRYLPSQKGFFYDFAIDGVAVINGSQAIPNLNALYGLTDRMGLMIISETGVTEFELEDLETEALQLYLLDQDDCVFIRQTYFSKMYG